MLQQQFMGGKHARTYIDITKKKNKKKKQLNVNQFNVAWYYSSRSMQTLVPFLHCFSTVDSFDQLVSVRVRSLVVCTRNARTIYSTNAIFSTIGLLILISIELTTFSFTLDGQNASLKKKTFFRAVFSGMVDNWGLAFLNS